MTDVNKLRQLNAKCKRFMNSVKKGHIDLDRLKDIDISDVVDKDNFVIYFCRNCPHEDIGYCGLRRSPITEADKKIQYCIPAFIEVSDEELEKYNKRLG